MAPAVGVEAAHLHALVAQQVEVDIGHGELAGRRETLGLGQRRTVLEDRGLAVPGEIGGGFARTGRGVQIGRHAARRLRGAQQPPRLRLADRDVAGGQVGEHRRAGQCGLRAGRHRDPDVLADLGVHDQARHVLGREQQVGAERRGQRPDGDLAAHHPVTHHEMPRLVEFAVVGQMHLRHHTEQPAAMDRQRAVVQRSGMAQRRADQQQRQQIGRRRDQVRDRGLHRVQQRGLVQQVADRVARHAEFRKHRKRHAAPVAGLCHLEDRRHIRHRVGERAARRAGGDAGEAVAVDRAELCRNAHRAGHPLMSCTQYGARQQRRHPGEACTRGCATRQGRLTLPHCERSEAIAIPSRTAMELTASLRLLAMTRKPRLS